MCRDLTETHVTVLQLLVTLATSSYSQVRCRAQAVLARALDTLPGSHLAITDQLLGLLGPAAGHEQLKGALYILLQNRLLLSPSWGLQCRLWPALIRSPHSEKPSISALLRSVSGRKSHSRRGIMSGIITSHLLQGSSSVSAPGPSIRPHSPPP